MTRAGIVGRIPPSAICSPEAVATARDAVTQSVALLKNEAGRLPLTPDGEGSDLGAGRGTAVVIGPSAVQPWSMTSYYGPSTSCDDAYNTIIDAVSQHVNATTFVAGLAAPLSTDRSGFAAAVAAAKAVDDVVLALGTDLSSAHEEMDAHNISLPAAQFALLEAVAAVAKRPVVVVLLTAVPLDISALLKDLKVGAVLHTGQPSVQTLGIGDLLYGRKVPAGRLIQTIYPASYADQISIFDFNMRPGPSEFPRPDCTAAQHASPAGCPKGTNPGRTHRFYADKAVLPFGFGLSYTTFSYSLAATAASGAAVSLEPVRAFLSDAADDPAAARRQFPSKLAATAGATAAAPPVIAYTVNVTNTGKMDADHVVLGMLTPPGAGVDGIPLQARSCCCCCRLLELLDAAVSRS